MVCLLGGPRFDLDSRPPLRSWIYQSVFPRVDDGEPIFHARSWLYSSRPLSSVSYHLRNGSALFWKCNLAQTQRFYVFIGDGHLEIGVVSKSSVKSAPKLICSLKAGKFGLKNDTLLLSWKGVMLHASQKKVSNDNIGVRETDYYEVRAI